MGSSESTRSNPESLVRHERLPVSESPECHVYCGRVETITSMHSAIVCIAHRNFKSLKWEDNWCAPDVRLERVLLLSTNLRSSTDEVDNCHEKTMKEVLNIGEPLRVLIQTSNTPYRCYKWLARCCLKVDVKESFICRTPIHLLGNHLCGFVQVVNNQYGIINFDTYVDTSEKAVFNRGSLILKPYNASNSISLENIAIAGIEVFLVVTKWRSVGNKSVFEEEMVRNNVHFKAVQVWTKHINNYIENRPIATNDSNIGAVHLVRQEAAVRSSTGTNCLNDPIPGTLMSFDKEWGLVEVGNKTVPFDVCPTFLYGLKLEGIPLQKIFFPGQIFKMFLEKEKVTKLQYGSSVSGEARETAIQLYCDKKSLPNDIRKKLEDLMERQSIWDD